MSQLSTSVVLITYNRAHLVLRALKSVFPQLRSSDEVIVVDDGSTDSTRQVLDPHMDRIRYFRQENQGQSAGMNFAFRTATKDLIALLDDDDEWMPGKLEAQRRVLEARPDVLYSTTSYVTVRQDEPNREGVLVNPGAVFEGWKDQHGPGVPFSSLAELPEGLEDFPVFFGNEYEALMRSDYMVGGLLVLRREAAGEHLRYPEDIQFCKDWECHARLARAGSVAYLDRDFYRWCDHSGTRYADLKLLEKASSRLTVLERIWGQDEAFMAQHGREVELRIESERILRIKGLLKQGDARVARRELSLLGSRAPSGYRLLAMLPEGVVRAGVRARRKLREMASARRAKPAADSRGTP
jgi:glycosyltransferase involved in cell wall biosynthesis